MKVHYSLLLCIFKYVHNKRVFFKSMQHFNLTFNSKISLLSVKQAKLLVLMAEEGRGGWAEEGRGGWAEAEEAVVCAPRPSLFPAPAPLAAEQRGWGELFPPWLVPCVLVSYSFTQWTQKDGWRPQQGLLAGGSIPSSHWASMVSDPIAPSSWTPASSIMPPCANTRAFSLRLWQPKLVFPLWARTWACSWWEPAGIFLRDPELKGAVLCPLHVTPPHPLSSMLCSVLHQPWGRSAGPVAQQTSSKIAHTQPLLLEDPRNLMSNPLDPPPPQLRSMVPSQLP